MKRLLHLVVVCIVSGWAASPSANEAHPSMYSFADVYRLTVSGAAATLSIAEPMLEPQLPQFRMAAAAQPAAVPELRFAISPVPGPDRWLLLVAGIAAAAWVAHRRLTGLF